MCHFKTPIFNPKFPLQSISFSQRTEQSAPEHHHFRVFAAPNIIIFQISPCTAGLLRPARARSVPPTLRGTSRPECSQTSAKDHQFHATARARDPHFHGQTRSRPLQRVPFSRSSRTRAPRFSLRRGKVSRVPPPPPESASLMLIQSHPQLSSACRG